MYFLFQDRLVTIVQIKKTFSLFVRKQKENHGDIFPQSIIKIEFWDTWENECHFNPSFVVLELFRVFSTI